MSNTGSNTTSGGEGGGKKERKGLSRGLKALIALSVIAVVIALAVIYILINYYIINLNSNPIRVFHTAVGISYAGPPTSAIAVQYCVLKAQVVSDVIGQCHGFGILPYVLVPRSCPYEPYPEAYYPPGYGIELGVRVNDYDIYNAYGGAWTGDRYNPVTINTKASIYFNGAYLGTYLGPPADKCGWLVISIRGDKTFVGYSSDGNTIEWFYNVTTGPGVIAPGRAIAYVGGPGMGEGVEFDNAYIVIAMWYWDGHEWVRAPVRPTVITGAEYILYAYEDVSGNVAIVSWPVPYDASTLVPQVQPPSFTP